MRLLVARRPWRRPPQFWLVTLALALGLGATVTTTLGAAEARLDALGPLRTVAVATRDLAPGTVLQPDDVAWVAAPAGALATDAATGDEPVVGRTASSPIARGEPVVRARLAPSGVTGVAAETPAGRRALAVPIDDRSPPLAAGQHVQLYAPAGAVGDGRSARSVARDAIVLEVDERRATVAVGADDVDAAVTALLDGAVLVVVVAGA